jgi:drug/metabolite transporter (DMT)-like permease
VTSILLALGASLAWGLSDFGGGLSARRLAVPLVLAVSQAAGLGLAAAVVAAEQPPTPAAGQLAWGAAAGLAGVIGLAAFYRALAVGTMGIVAPITATAIVVPVAYGVARGERPSALQATGLALAFAGVIAVSFEPIDAPDRRRRLGVGVGLALLAALGFGCALLFLSRAAAGGTLWATLSMRAVGAPLVVAGCFLLRPQHARPSRVWLLLACVGLGDTGANTLYSAATKHGLLSVVAVLASLYPVILVVLGRIFLAERMAHGQLAGIAAVLAGVALISAG